MLSIVGPVYWTVSSNFSVDACWRKLFYADASSKTAMAGTNTVLTEGRMRARILWPRKPQTSEESIEKNCSKHYNQPQRKKNTGIVAGKVAPSRHAKKKILQISSQKHPLNVASVTVPFANHRPSLLEQERLVLAEHLIHDHIVHTNDYIYKTSGTAQLCVCPYCRSRKGFNR